MTNVVPIRPEVNDAYRLDAIEVLRIHLPLLAAPYSDHPAYRAEWSLTDG